MAIPMLRAFLHARETRRALARVARTGGAAARLMLVAMPGIAAASSSLSTTGCAAAGATSFDLPIGGGSTTTNADCSIVFGASDSTAMLRMSQADGAGTAMSGSVNGTFDGGFGTAGLYAGNVGSTTDTTQKVLVQPDGMLLVAGQTGTHVFVSRLSSAGVADPLFGTAGTTIVDLPGGDPDTFGSIALQPDGRIVIAGRANDDIALARLTSSGVLDTTFSGDGLASFDDGSLESASSVAVRADGMIAVGGTVQSSNVLLLQVRPDGVRDPNFAAPLGYVSAVFGGGTFGTTRVAWDRGGRLLVTGQRWSGFGMPYVARYTRSGVLDTTFNGVGYVSPSLGTSMTSMAGSAVLPDGRILFAGTGPTGLQVARLTAAGALDTTYGVAGVRVVDPSAATESATGLAVDGTGAVLVSTTVDAGGATGSGGLLRLLPDGSIDTRFSGDGWLPDQVDGTYEDGWNDVAQAQDGSILLGGSRRSGGTDWDVVARRLAPPAIADYGIGGDFTAGTTTFGACLRRLDGLGTQATWTANATCPASNGAWWNAVPATSSATPSAEIAATTTSGVTNATAALRFGVRVSTTTTAGTYSAPIAVEVIAPNLDPPANTVAPTISGTTTARRTLTASPGTWTGSATISYAYQWQRCTPGCVDIAGATASTYLLLPGDVGSTIRVQVTGTNTEGSVSALSAQTASITAAAATGLYYLSGFEHQTASAMGGGLASYFDTNGAGTITPDTTVRHSGSASMRFTSAGGWRQWNVNPATVSATGTARLFFNVAKFPTGRQVISEISSATAGYCEIYVSSTGQLSADIDGVGNATQAGPTIATDEWHMAEFSCDMSGTTWRVDWRIDGGPQTQVVLAGQSARTIDEFQIGIDRNSTMDVAFDDVAASSSIADYPLGAGKVLGYVPSGIGTLSGTPANLEWTTNNFTGVTAFTAGDANTSPGRAALIDEWPVTTGAAADGTHQTTATAFYDVNVADTAEAVAPDAVSFVGAHRENGAYGGGNDVMLKANAGGGQTVYQKAPVDGTATEDYFSAVLPTAGAGAAWTTANFNAMTMRVTVGGTPADPPRTDALLVEADFPVTQLATNTAVPTISGANRVGQPLTSTNGSWTPAPTGYTYQWQRCSATGTACVDIAGANAATYTPVALDQGKTLRVRVMAITPVGNQAATSAVTSIIAAGSPTLTYETGFEAGTVSTLGGGLFTGAANVAATTDFARNGRFALRATGDGVAAADANVAAAGTVGVTRVAVLLEELPAASMELLEFNPAAGSSCDVHYSGGRLVAGIGAVTQTSTMTVSPDRWYVVDMRCDVSGATRTLDWVVDGVSQTQVSTAIAASTLSGVHVGQLGTGLGAGVALFDDWAVSATSADYPLGSGKVVGLTPSGTGTHSGETAFDYTANGAASWTAFTAGTDNNLVGDTGSAPTLSDWPPAYVAGVSGRLVRQNITGKYLEYQLGDSGEAAPPNAVRVVGAHDSATPAAVQNATLTVMLGASSTLAYTLDPIAGGTNYGAGILTTRPGGGLWTAADVDAIRLRLNSSNIGTAVAERPWTNALLAEADFPAGDMPVSVNPPQVQLPYDVPKVGDELTARDGTWTGPPITRGHAYQWLRCTAAGAGCVAIAGEHGPSYVLQAADAGSTVRVVDLAIGDAGAQGARSAQSDLISTQPTFDYFTGFEHGTLATSPDLFFSVDPGVSIDTSSPRSGAREMTSVGSGGGSSEVEWHEAVGATYGVTRMAFRFDALPASTLTLGEFKTTTGKYTRLRMSSAGVMSVDFFDGSAHANTPGATLQPNRWYLLDLRFDPTGATWRTDWRVDGTPQPQASYAIGAADTMLEYQWGVSNTAVITTHFDDVAASSVYTDYPIGNGHVLGVRLDALNGGSATGNFGYVGVAAPAGLNDSPMTSTSDYLFQSAITSSLTDNVAISTARPTDTGTARALRAISAYGATAAGTNDLTVKVRRPGDTVAGAPVAFTGNTALAALTFTGKLIAAPAGGWTQAAIDATDWLVGFSTDVAPNPTLHALMFEAEYR
jgi:uncharacterized delta-60 repeat protein